MGAVASSGEDRGESASLMEPLLLGEGTRHRPALADLAFDLASRSAGFRRSLPGSILASLADLVRSMNCYYSNLIEGHDTHPIDIERALNDDYSAEPEKRDLQLEARAHIDVQAWIDRGGLAGRATSASGIREIHRRFTTLLPEPMRWVGEADDPRRERVVPGELRMRDVAVGRHIAVSPGAVPRFLQRFEVVYRDLGRADTVLASAAAHHRLLWIHPFVDGNGRVARLMSHAMMLDALDTRGVWSIARGLARSEASYKAHLAAADLTRRNDLDGRGHLSEATLAGFTRFFLEACIDQVAFMESLMQPDRLRDRIIAWASEEARAGVLPVHASRVLEAVLYRGELPRGEVAALLATSDRQARRITAALIDRGALTAAGPRDALRLAFPAALAARWMPGLFPDR